MCLHHLSIMKELRILNGEKKGAFLSLDEEPVSVGSAIKNELILNGAGIAPEHFSISMQSNDAAKIDALEAGIFDARGDAVIGSTIVKKGMPFKVCDVWLLIQDESEKWPSRLPQVKIQKRERDQVVAAKTNLFKRYVSSKSAFLISLIGLVFFGINAFANSLYKKTKMPPAEIATETHVKVSSNSITSTQESRKVDTGLLQENMPSLPNVLNLVEEMLIDREILGVTALLNGEEIELRGRINKSTKRVLERMILRFKTDYPLHPVLVDLTEDLKPSLPFNIASVIYGPFAHIKTRDGERLSKGQSKQGYTLVEISKTRLVFEGEQTVEINW